MRLLLFSQSSAWFLCATAVFANPAEQPTPGVLLAEQFVRIAHQATMSEPLDTVAIEAAVALISEASLLSPDDPAIWRSLHEVAQMADLPSVSNHAIQNLLRVSPTQPTAQLARLRDVIDTSQTLETRIAMYEVLLSKENNNKLDASVASRLALDAAYLQRQAGNVQQFARWLAEAVALDPSYFDAITLATGFFGDETADIYTRAELLAAASLANIKDQTIQIALAEFLMAYGDYEDARAMYEIILGEGAGDSSLISDTLLADIVLSQWASGDVIAAMDTLLTRQMAVDIIFRARTKEQQPRLDPLELARIHAPLVPKLATVRAALYSSMQDKTQASMALESAMNSMFSMSKLYESMGGKAVHKAVELHMQATWVILWLSDDYESAESLIELVEAGAIIETDEKQQLDGWIAFRKGEFETAKAILEPLTSVSARAGLALVLLEEGNKKGAALELLAIAKNHGGTILGVWSKNKLEEIVGGKFQIRQEIPQLQKLMGSVLQTMDILNKDPRPPIDVQIIPTKLTYDPYEPVLVEIKISNNAPVPLSIAHNGPIQPLFLLEVNLGISSSSSQGMPPIIIPINEEFVIQPRGNTSVTVDLRNYWLGGVFDSAPLRGTSFSLTGTVNFTARETTDRQGMRVLVYEAGRFGQQAVTSTIRVNGIRLTDQWLSQALVGIEEVRTTGDLVTYALLTWVVSDTVFIEVVEPLITPPPGEEVQQLAEGARHKNQDKALTALLTTFPKLNPTDQAWIISVMSNDPMIEAVKGMMKEPESTVSQLAWLIRFANPHVPDEALDDPQILAGLQSEDTTINAVARWVYAWIHHVVDTRNSDALTAK